MKRGLSEEMIDTLRRMRRVPIYETRTRRGRVRYLFVDGELAQTRTVRALLRRKLIEPQDDGLLPGASQTYRVRV